ncbi:glycoside hydrolase family 16 protein [Marinifilum sp.]|uniref:glycoside hydrolase family 16 protein n=1 Tax=Marinifilum sp. TaxID=2033137 RepID=UPI003BA9A0E3
MNNMRLLVVLVLILFSSCTGEKNKTSVPEGYELEWRDEFNQADLNSDKWAYRTDNKHRSIQQKKNVKIKDGSLILNLRVFDKPVEGKMAAGAGIVSTRRFKYGYYEVKAKLGDGIDDDNDGKTDEGWHHSFWAMAASIDDKGEVNTTYPGIRRTEIDCFENPTEHRHEPELNGLNNFVQHVIVWDESGKEWGRLPKPPADVLANENFDANQWHVYGFEWDKDQIKWYVDGKITKVADYPADKFVHDEINVWLTAIAANWNGKDQEESRAEYDYFRFYKKKE